MRLGHVLDVSQSISSRAGRQGRAKTLSSAVITWNGQRALLLGCLVEPMQGMEHCELVDNNPIRGSVTDSRRITGLLNYPSNSLHPEFVPPGMFPPVPCQF